MLGVVSTPPAPGRRCWGLVEKVLGVSEGGVFYFLSFPEPVIYKLIELLMKPPELRVSVGVPAALPPTVPTPGDLNTGNLQEAEGL